MNILYKDPVTYSIYNIINKYLITNTIGAEHIREHCDMQMSTATCEFLSVGQLLFSLLSSLCIIIVVVVILYYVCLSLFSFLYNKLVYNLTFSLLIIIVVRSYIVFPLLWRTFILLPISILSFSSHELLLYWSLFCFYSVTAIFSL